MREVALIGQMFDAYFFSILKDQRESSAVVIAARKADLGDLPHLRQRKALLHLIWHLSVGWLVERGIQILHD